MTDLSLGINTCNRADFEKEYSLRYNLKASSELTGFQERGVKDRNPVDSDDDLKVARWEIHVIKNLHFLCSKTMLQRIQ